MQAIQLTAPSITAFRPTELPQPQAGRGEVLLRLRAATLNFLDVAPLQRAILPARPFR